MKTKIINILLVVVFLSSSVVNAQLKRRPRRRHRPRAAAVTSIGVRVGKDFKHDQLFIGGHLWMPLGIFWKMAPSFEYYFVDENEDYNRWQFNADFMFKPRPRYPFYLGGGVAVNYTIPTEGDSKTKVGGNAIVGLDFGRIRLPSMYPYIQARWTFLKNETYFSLLGGINLILK